MTTRINLDGSESLVDTDTQEFLKTESQNFDNFHLPEQWKNLRGYRESKLALSDWTQVSDGPLDSTTKAAWATYRTKLRDIPANAGAPIQIPDADWPLAPGETSIPEDAIRFVKSGDPLGLGTTSWIEINNYYAPKHTGNTTLYTGSGIGSDIILICNVSILKIGDTIRYKETLDSVPYYDTIITGIGSTVSTSTESGDVDLCRVSIGTTLQVGLNTASPVEYFTPIAQSSYNPQEKPSPTIAIVGVNTTGISTGDTLNVTVSSKNVESPFELDWNLVSEEPGSHFEASDFTVGSTKGTLQIVASSDRDVLSISTVTFTFASSISIASTEYIHYINFNIPTYNINSEKVGISSI